MNIVKTIFLSFLMLFGIGNSDASTYYTIDYVTFTCRESNTRQGPEWKYSKISNVCEKMGFDYAVREKSRTMLRFRPQDP